MKRLITICAIGFLLVIGGTASGALVESGGQARLDYTVSVAGTDYQHTHAEAGFDIASGTPIMTDDDYSLPYSYSYASTTHSWGEAEGDTGGDYLEAANHASADGSILESWGYGLSIYRLSFTLDTEETIYIDYTFDGYIWVDSYVAAGAGFSVGLLTIWIDDPGMAGDPAYDSDPECDDFVEVTGIGSDSKTLSDSGTISQLLAAGPHEIAFMLETYENAEVPEPATIALLGLGALSLLRRRKA